MLSRPPLECDSHTRLDFANVLEKILIKLNQDNLVRAKGKGLRSLLKFGQGKGAV